MHYFLHKKMVNLLVGSEILPTDGNFATKSLYEGIYKEMANCYSRSAFQSFYGGLTTMLLRGFSFSRHVIWY
jgi:hypothetical protein